LRPKRKITKKHMSESPDVFPCIPSVQFSALNTNTYQTIVNIRGIINISLLATINANVSSSITHPKILLTYPIFIEVTPIVAPIIICKRSLVLAERETISSIKLTKVITHQNHKISPSL